MVTESRDLETPGVQMREPCRYCRQNRNQVGGGLWLMRTSVHQGKAQTVSHGTALKRTPFSRHGVRIHRGICNADQDAHNVSRLIPLVRWEALHLSMNYETGPLAPQTVTPP